MLNKIIANATCLVRNVVPLTLRILIGWQFFLTGKGKLAHIDKTTGFFSKLHIPMPEFHAYFIGTLETVGGLLLIAGLLTRLVSLPLLGTLVVAYLTAHREDAFSSVEDFITATPFPYLAVVLFLIAYGPGRLSVDRWLTPLFDKLGIGVEACASDARTCKYTRGDHPRKTDA